MRTNASTTPTGDRRRAGVGFPPVFERFTERARQVVVLAQEEARALKHSYIGTEHLLLGLLREEEGVAARVLASLGVTLEAARARVEEIVGAGDEATAGQVPFAPRAKKVLELALREALAIGHNYIGTEHILLGLARENEGAAAAVLLHFDVDDDRIRSEVIEVLGPHAIGDPIPASGRRRFRGRRGFETIAVQQPTWEYRVEERESIDAGWLNELGAEGWELVAVAGRTLVFKRRCHRPLSLRAAG
jgi:ATP-dependent Clp protease ATP-binding subunit ClpA